MKLIFIYIYTSGALRENRESGEW